ncbi:unnamed protein product [Phaedon cochleariae]|uniref:Uncharacterized protein n=1 Tax=Phaedon cochleariae TaxID=80249 RepID=A0A9N9SBL0_PHACE|nr:unnamed protein product [Phaedon cochleariae]
MSSQEDINPDSSPDSPGFNKDAAFEAKPKPKAIRVLTVLAYVLSVSMAAIMLSIYYIFMWDGRPHIGARRGGPEAGHESFSIPIQFTESVENFTEPHHYMPNLIYFTRRNSSAKIEQWKANEKPVEGTEGMFTSSSSPSFFTHSVENNSIDSVENNSTDQNYTYYHETTEMQQQLADGDSEALKILPAYETATETSSTENTTWPRDYETLEDFSGASPFMKKLMDHRYEEDY